MAIENMSSSDSSDSAGSNRSDSDQILAQETNVCLISHSSYKWVNPNSQSVQPICDLKSKWEFRVRFATKCSPFQSIVSFNY